MRYVKLNNGVQMPILGFGTYKVSDPEQGVDAICDALKVGYRLIDTAQNYGNETIVGEALRKSDVPRSELFVTTKVRIGDASYEKTKAAFAASLKNLMLDFVDLYLVHHPFGDYYGAWRAMCELYDEGKIRAIGVSNFYSARLIDFILNNHVLPAVNQMEVHPFFQQVNLQEMMVKYGIQLESWGPFAQGSKELLNNGVLIHIGRKYGKSAAQVALRWTVQRDIVVIPKSVNPERIRENFDIFDFELSLDDMASIAELDIDRSTTHIDPVFAENIIAKHSSND